MEITEYKSNLPYPEIRVAGKNADYAAMMLSNVGGQRSEMTAIGLYVYSRLVCTEKAIAEALGKIAVVEMHLLHIFGELAKLLGQNPRLWNKRQQGMVYWSPRFIPYSVKQKEILENTLRGELDTIHKYSMQCEHIKDGNLVQIIKRIILDEEIHVKILRKLMQEYS